MAESIGDAYIQVHADTSPFNREVEKQLDDVATSSEKELNRSGNKIGDKVSNGIGDTLKKRGKSFARAIEDGTKNTIVQVRSLFRFDRIRDALRRRFRKDVGDTISDEVGQALDRAGRAGGPISKLGQAFADAIGAGFNVSGRSPLIALLIPALAALLGLILALVQAVNAFVAVLFILPGLLASIGLQVGVVMIAFQGMGEAISGAFAAKNIKELDAALKGLAPSARLFVMELLPLKDFFKSLQLNVQQNFFSQLLGVIPKIRAALGPSLMEGFITVARSAGQFLRDFGLLLASPGFVRFFNELIPATARWLEKFSMALFGDRGFITAMIDMANELMPFMEDFGEIIIRNLDRLSGLIFQIGTNKGTKEWLDSMSETLQLFFDFLFKVGEFLLVFMSQLDKAGGKEVLKELIHAVALLTYFLSSPAGLKAMEGLVTLGILGIQSFTGLLIAVLAVFAALETFKDWLEGSAGPAILGFFQAIGQAAVDGATFVGVWITRIIGGIGDFFVAVGNIILGAKDSFIKWVTSIIIKIMEFLNWIRGIPTRVSAAFKNFGTLLINAGRSLVQGLINGIREKLGALFSLVGGITSRIAGFFGASPAKEGALSGKGWSLYRGQNIIKDLAKGMEMEVDTLRETSTEATSNIVFGPNSIQMTIHGPVPDQAQARRAGAAMGQGAADVIAARNTRLAVRTL